MHMNGAVIQGWNEVYGPIAAFLVEGRPFAELLSRVHDPHSLDESVNNREW